MQLSGDYTMRLQRLILLKFSRKFIGNFFTLIDECFIHKAEHKVSFRFARRFPICFVERIKYLMQNRVQGKRNMC